jgi:N6-L-threonylcarbamoyladenine synthase
MDDGIYVLGIETSCDETAAAVLQGGRRILANVVYSQAKLHEKYGGVVPEVASRDHLKKLPYVLDEALERAGVELEQIGLLGATRGPGLVGALLVGLSMAKGLAYGLDVPLVGVNHLEGHLFAHYVERGDEAPPPFVALIVSGGHTSLVHVRAWGDYRTLGETRDDAAGEAFDKVGKLLGLGYPAGPEIDRLARQGDLHAVELPRPMLEEPGFDFSFAGLKTAVLYQLKRQPDTPVEDLAASFQEAVVDVLVEKTLKAAESLKLRRIVIVGGVAANSRLRERFEREAECRGYEIYFPSMALCTDNAAMIAAAAHFHYTQGDALSRREALRLSPQAVLKL